MRRRAWIVLSLLGVVLMAFGVARGEMDMVFRKAVLICLECIGVG